MVVSLLTKVMVDLHRLDLKIVGYEGGTTGVTTGDVLIDGSGTQDNGVNFFASGTGTTSSGGF